MNKENQIQQIAEKAIKDIQEAAANAVKVEKEYRAGEWAPNAGKGYWYIVDGCNPSDSTNTERHYDISRFNACNVFPTKAIAEAAKAHADWWREFDMSDEGGEFEIYAHGGLLDTWDTKGFYGNPKFTTIASARAAIERLGGEKKVIDMLTRGRVFRFKWGGE